MCSFMRMTSGIGRRDPNLERLGQANDLHRALLQYIVPPDKLGPPAASTLAEGALSSGRVWKRQTDWTLVAQNEQDAIVVSLQRTFRQDPIAESGWSGTRLLGEGLGGPSQPEDGYYDTVVFQFQDQRLGHYRHKAALTFKLDPRVPPLHQAPGEEPAHGELDEHVVTYVRESALGDQAPGDSLVFAQAVVSRFEELDIGLLLSEVVSGTFGGTSLDEFNTTLPVGEPLSRPRAAGPATPGEGEDVGLALRDAGLEVLRANSLSRAGLPAPTAHEERVLEALERARSLTTGLFQSPEGLIHELEDIKKTICAGAIRFQNADLAEVCRAELHKHLDRLVSRLEFLSTGAWLRATELVLGCCEVYDAGDMLRTRAEPIASLVSQVRALAGSGAGPMFAAEFVDFFHEITSEQKDAVALDEYGFSILCTSVDMVRARMEFEQGAVPSATLRPALLRYLEHRVGHDPRALNNLTALVRTIFDVDPLKARLEQTHV